MCIIEYYISSQMNLFYHFKNEVNSSTAILKTLVQEKANIRHCLDLNTNLSGATSPHTEIWLMIFYSENRNSYHLCIWCCKLLYKNVDNLISIHPIQITIKQNSIHTQKFQLILFSHGGKRDMC